MNTKFDRGWRIKALVVLGALALLALGVGLAAQTQSAPKYKVDSDWPKPLPNKWKMGGVTGLAVDKDDNVWVYDRPNDLTDIELEAELTPPIADCCMRPPSMIHIDKEGNVIGSFDPPQGHGMAVDSKGFIYDGNSVNGIGNVRKYDPKTGKMVAELPHVPDRQPGAGGGDAGPETRSRSRPRQRRAGRGIYPAGGRASAAATRCRCAGGAGGGGSGFSREVSSDDADDRGRNRRSSA